MFKNLLKVVVIFYLSALGCASVIGDPQEANAAVFVTENNQEQITPLSSDATVDVLVPVPSASAEEIIKPVDNERGSRHLGFDIDIGSFGRPQVSGGYGFYAPNYGHHHHHGEGYGQQQQGWGHGGYGHEGYGHGGYGQGGYGQGGYGHGGYGGGYGHGGYGQGGYGQGGYGGGYGHGHGHGHGGFGGYEEGFGEYEHHHHHRPDHHHHHHGFGRFLQEYAPIYPNQHYPSKILYGLESQTPLVYNSVPQGLPVSPVVIVPQETIPPLAPQDIAQQNIVVPPAFAQEIKPIAPEVPKLDTNKRQESNDEDEQECICKKKNKSTESASVEKKEEQSMNENIKTKRQ